jgi:hypothetical protein
MNRRSLGVVAPFAALALVGATITAIASAAHTRSTVVIGVFSVQTFGSASNAPPNGLRVGEVIVERDRLVNAAPQFGKPAGASVGNDQVRLTILTPTTGSVVGTASFPDGTVKIAGRVTLTGTITIPVVGGTGRYALASGTYTEPTGGGGAAHELNVYRLRLP